MGRVFGFVVIFGLGLLSVRGFGYDKFGIWITGCCFVFRAILGFADKDVRNSGMIQDQSRS